MSELINFLKQAGIFYHFTPTQLQMVAKLCQECTYGKGETILEESSNSKDLYIIIQGEVDVLVNPALVGGPEAEQGDMTIATLRRGQSFGEVALVD
jgi:CRP-like cAMP-binding protein